MLSSLSVLSVSSLSKVSTALKWNLISFHTSQAAASSGLHLLASRIIALPSAARSRPSLRACTHAPLGSLNSVGAAANRVAPNPRIRYSPSCDTPTSP